MRLSMSSAYWFGQNETACRSPWSAGAFLSPQESALAYSRTFLPGRRVSCFCYLFPSQYLFAHRNPPGKAEHYPDDPQHHLQPCWIKAEEVAAEQHPSRYSHDHTDERHHGLLRPAGPPSGSKQQHSCGDQNPGRGQIKPGIISLYLSLFLTKEDGTSCYCLTAPREKGNRTRSSHRKLTSLTEKERTSCPCRDRFRLFPVSLRTSCPPRIKQ